MKSAVETLNPTRVRLTVEVPFEELKDSLDAAYKKINQQVTVKGFRKGKIPARVIDQRFGRGAVLEEAVNDALPKFYTDAVNEADIGLTPQSVNSMGYRVQGRGEEAAQQLLRDAKAVQDAGAFAVVLELVPAELAAEVTRTLHIPTVGIGAGPDTDAQVLVWTDMLGLTGGRMPKFVKQYADLRKVMGDAAKAYAEDVVGGTFPADEHSVH